MLDVSNQQIAECVSARRCDDLVFLIERGGQAADKLEDLVRESRNMAGVGPRPGRDTLTEPEPAIETAGETVREPAKAEPVILTADPQEAPVVQTPAAKIEDGELRSEAERELLEAIRSAR